MTLWGRGKGAKTSFVDFVRNSLQAGKTIRIVTDQWGNATLAEDLALGIWKLVAGGHNGVYHVAGSEWNSRFQWAEAIADPLWPRQEPHPRLPYRGFETGRAAAPEVRTADG